MRSPRLRWSAPEIRRLGKTCGAVLDALERAGGRATVSEIAAALETKRPRDLRRRVIARLEGAAVVECSGDTVALVGDWLAALEREREIAGEHAAENRDRERYRLEQKAFLHRRKIGPPDRAPTEAEMRERREGAPERRRRSIETAIASLFAARPEYRGRRVGQIVCRLHDHLPDDFPRGEIGYPKDAEVESILDGEGVAA